MIKNICCIGAGYVGGPTMAVIALKCPDINIHVVDINEVRIESWNSKDLNKLPIYEPGLSEIIKTTRNKNLFFSTKVEEAINLAEMIFISVNTPTKSFGEGKGMASDLTYVEKCARLIAKVAKTPKIVVEKSTLPVKTAETIQKIFKQSGNEISHEILSNPEFLAEGTAIKDLLDSDRVLIGGESTVAGKKAVNILADIYSRWISKDRIVTTNLWSSELSKLTANAFLAQRISSINSISALCEKTGADVQEISKAIGYDSRIGSKFLNASVGFGGSCFQKDIMNLVYLCKKYNLNEVADYWHGVIKINDYQKNRFSNIIKTKLFNTVNQKKITLLGWAFKKNTNDSRESAAIYIAYNLLEEGAILNIYDPKIKINKIKDDLKLLYEQRERFDYESKLDNIFCFNNSYDASINSHALLVLTEWDEFKSIDFKKIYNSMEKPAFVFDGRKILNDTELIDIGFNVYEIGKNIS